MPPESLTPFSRQNLMRRWQSARLVLLSIAAGLVTGLMAALLRLVLEVLARGAAAVTGYAPPGTPGEGGLLMSFGAVTPWGLLLFPAVGALYAWLLPRDGEALNQAVRVGLGKRSAASKSRRAAAEGEEAEAEADAEGEREWTLGSALQTLGASTLGAAGGLLVGRDAAFAALGRLSMRVLQVWTRLSPGELRTLVLAGTAAGLGAALHAPLAAAVFVAEMLYRRFEFEYEVLTSCVLAAVTGYAVYGLFFGFQPLFLPPQLQGAGLSNLLPGLAVTLAATAAAWLSLRLGEWLARPQRAGARLGAGAAFGALTGALAFLVGAQVVGDGSGWLGLSLSGLLGGGVLGKAALGAALWRWLLLTLGLGLAFGAGVLPSAAIGGLLGGGLGTLLGGDAGLSTLLGTAAFITVTHNTPVAATLLAAAWGGDAVLPAALLATGVAHLLSGEIGLLPAQVASRSKRTEAADAATLVLSEISQYTAPHDHAQTERQLYRRRVPRSWGGVAVGQLSLPPSVEVVGLLRDGQVMLPRRSLRLLRGDEVMLLARPDAYAALDALLDLPELR